MDFHFFHDLVKDYYCDNNGRHALDPLHAAAQYLARLDRQKKRFDFAVEQVTVDAECFTAAVCHRLKTRGTYAVMGYRRQPHKAGYF